jgi:hypothetical protein
MARDEIFKQPFVTVRLPVDVKTWLQHESARYGASENSEIIRALRQRMDSEPPKKATG